MSYVDNVLTACPTLQAKLDEVWQMGNCVGADDRIPHLQFLLSQENTRPIKMMMTPGGGKVRSVQVVYKRRHLEGTVQSNQPNPNCGVGQPIEDNNQTYTLDTSVNLQTQGFLLTREALEDVCMGNGEIFAREMFHEFDVLRRKIATQSAVQSVALTGTWGNGLFTTGTDPGEVTANEMHVKTLTTVAANTINLLDSHPVIWNAWEDIGGCGTPFIVGGTTLRNYYQATAHGCCADQGIDLGGIRAEFGYAYARDRRVAAALASEDKSLIMSPGAHQLLQYSASPWRDGMPQEVYGAANYVHRQFSDPMSGLVFDWTLQDDCGTITSNLTWTGKVIALPDDMFAPTDVYAGYNGVAVIKVLNA